MGNTTRLRLPYAELADSADMPAVLRNLAGVMDGVAKDDHGTLGARPAPSKRGKYYYATDTKILYRDNGTAWIPVCVPTGAPDYFTPGTFPPGSPVDGQEAYLHVGVGTFAEAMWHLRYNAGSASTYKWERIGGGWWIAESDSSEAKGNGGYAAFTDATNTTLTTPRAGEYEIAAGCTFSNAFSQISFVGVQFGASITDAEAMTVDMASSGVIAYLMSASRKYFKTLAINDAVQLKWKNLGLNVAIFTNKWVMMRPVRIS